MKEHELQNLGEMLKEYKDPKVQSKIDNLQESLDVITKRVKQITPDMPLQEAKDIMIDVLRYAYKQEHTLTRQSGYLRNKRSTNDVLMMGYNIILSKTDQLEKLQRTEEY